MAAKKGSEAVETLSQHDAEVTQALGEYRGALPVRALSRIGKLGDQPELRLISGGVVAAALLFGNARLLRAGVRMLVAHELATAMKDFVKTRIDRTRPRNAGAPSEAKAKPGQSTEKAKTSFPSGHAAGAVAVAQAFAREFPEHRAPALAAAAVVGLAQVPKCAHYPSDVAAGSFVGAAAEALLAGGWPSSPPSPRLRHRPVPRRR